MKNAKRTVLLCDKGDCCPKITFAKEIVIEDDFGGKVTLSKKEFTLLKEMIKSNEL